MFDTSIDVTLSCVLRMSAAKLLSLGAAVKSAAAVAVKSMVLPGIAGTGALHVTEHVLKVPVDHSDHSAFPPIDVFVREVCLASKADEEQPYLLYLQGGPGFPSPRPTCPPSGWMHAALSKNFRVLLLDQRGTGRSSPITAESLTSLECLDAEPERMAAYLSHFAPTRSSETASWCARPWPRGRSSPCSGSPSAASAS